MEEKIREEVKKRYGKIAINQSACCTSSCCSATQEELAYKVGYSMDDIAQVPEGANLGLGCGSPLTFSAISEGDVVVDLGSGAGFDAFLAAKKVGEKGFVYGIDMTDEMVEKSRENARKGNFKNVSFLKGIIEEIPLPDETADLVISNCVINLSPQKERVFRESFRILKKGGSLTVSDIVLRKKLPRLVLENKELYSSCISGAVLKENYIQMIEEAGFKEIKILSEKYFPFDLCLNELKDERIIEWITNNRKEAEEVSNSLLSVTIIAKKPF